MTCLLVLVRSHNERLRNVSDQSHVIFAPRSIPITAKLHYAMTGHHRLSAVLMWCPKLGVKHMAAAKVALPPSAPQR